MMLPLRPFGLQVNSIGLLIPPEKASAWRGPMASGALDQLLKQTLWDDLDYLIVDMPPGTGDIQLTMAQRAPVTGAVIVTTPQNVALLDAVKGINLFQTVRTPILGVVENMAVYTCSACGHQEHIFGQEGGQKLADGAGCEVLGHMPLKPAIRAQSDSGVPTLAQDPNSDESRIYRDMARKIGAKVALLGKNYADKFPSIQVK
jgi:ATP-binding protein involved in chromosome partitioning